MGFMDLQIDNEEKKNLLKRNEIVTFRVSTEEKDLILEGAYNDNQKKSTWIRNVIVGYAKYGNDSEI